MTTAYVITDSYGNNAGGASFEYVMATKLGWTLTADAVPGTGYINGQPTINFRARVPAALAAHPDIVIVAGGLNDWSNSIPAVVAEAQLCWAALASIPTIYAVIFSSSNAGAYGPTVVGPLAVALALGASGKVQFINAVGWVNGTGRVGATTGVGNGDIYASADAIHPAIPQGHAYLGTRLAQTIRPPATGLDY